MDTVFSEDDGNKGACKERNPSAEEMNGEQHMDRVSLIRYNIVSKWCLRWSREDDNDDDDDDDDERRGVEKGSPSTLPRPGVAPGFYSVGGM